MGSHQRPPWAPLTTPDPSCRLSGRRRRVGVVSHRSCDVGARPQSRSGSAWRHPRVLGEGRAWPRSRGAGCHRGPAEPLSCCRQPGGDDRRGSAGAPTSTSASILAPRVLRILPQLLSAPSAAAPRRSAAPDGRPPRPARTIARSMCPHGSVDEGSPAPLAGSATRCRAGGGTCWQSWGTARCSGGWSRRAGPCRARDPVHVERPREPGSRGTAAEVRGRVGPTPALPVPARSSRASRLCPGVSRGTEGRRGTSSGSVRSTAARFTWNG